ncbi:MAG: ABC transporter substrate-binding protein, partial [Endomicrobium sp.]|nr:ABC transporter substrate-binding protein [Endomicrobium sp.]
GIEDLRGKTIYSSGKGATPEYSLDYILKSNGIDPTKDVNIEYKSEHTECLAAVLNDENGIALLPQPFVTTALMKNKNLRVALDLTKEWEKINKNNDEKSSLVTGVLVARREFVDKYPEKVKNFLEEYKESVDFTNNNIEAAAKLIGENEIVKEEVAKKAIPECNITYIDNTEMQNKLSGYLKVLYDANPKSIGGKLPSEDFYYIK